MGSSHEREAIDKSAVERLTEFMEEHRRSGRPTGDFEGYEEQVHALCNEVEREALGEELSRYDSDVPVLQIDGVSHRRVLRSKREYLTAAGVVTVERNLYSTRDLGSRAIAPLEARAGILESYWTPRAARLALWSVAQMTPGLTEQLFARLGGMAPSRSSLDRLPKRLGDRWERRREGFEQMLRAQESVPRGAEIVAVSLDGVLVPMKDGERKAKRAEAEEQGRETRGPAGYQEASCATLTLYDGNRENLRTLRISRMPETGKEALKESLSQELAHVLNQKPKLELVKLADGARDNWTYLSKRLPAGEEVVDFYHAVEHLSTALAAAHGEESPRHRAEFERFRKLLEYDPRGVDKVIRALRYQRQLKPRSKLLAREVKYFARNRKRMRYLNFTERGLPIGSGMVEAACKTVVTQRLKQSGMHWRHQGGQSVLTFRAAAQSNRFDKAWALVSATYVQEVTLRAA